MWSAINNIKWLCVRSHNDILVKKPKTMKKNMKACQMYRTREHKIKFIMEK